MIINVRFINKRTNARLIVLIMACRDCLGRMRACVVQPVQLNSALLQLLNKKPLKDGEAEKFIKEKTTLHFNGHTFSLISSQFARTGYSGWPWGDLDLWMDCEIFFPRICSVSINLNDIQMHLLKLNSQQGNV